MILPDDMFTAVHLTVTPENKKRLPDILKRLASLGANGISLSASSPELAPEIQHLRDMVHDLHLNLVWDLPVPYSKINPVHLETGTGELRPTAPDGPGCTVEPDGDVLPAQGINKVAGNILRDPWEIIWQNAHSV